METKTSHGELSGFVALEVVAKQMDVAVACCSRELRYLWVNQKYADWLERPQDQIVGHLIEDMLKREDFEFIKNYFDPVLAGEKVTYERERHLPGVRRRWASATYTPTFDTNGVVDGWIGVVSDLTAQKLAEHDRLKHTALVESSQDAIICVDLDRAITSWNAAAERMFGYTEAEVVGQPLTILVPSEQRNEYSHILERLTAEGRVEHFETKRVTKTGKLLDVSLTIGPIRDSVGKLIGGSAIVHDISQRKIAEKDLRESEERFQLAARAGRVCAYEWDAITGEVARSGDHREILGLSQTARLTNEQFLERVHPDDLVPFLATMSALTPDKPTCKIIFRFQRPKGGIVWLQCSSRAFFDAEGKLLRIVGMDADVTAQKMAESALRESEERLRLGQWAARIGTYDWNIQTGEIVLTPELDAMYGLPPGGFAATRNRFEDLIHEDDQRRVRDLVHEALETGQAKEFEWRVVWPDGSVHWIAGRGQLIKSESGQPLRMVGVNMDVTERKHAERALSEMTRKLIAAQEQERTRIGRELHDDIGQRLALLALDMEQLEDQPSQLQNEIREVRRSLAQLSDDVQGLSHDLHSAKLEYLGVAEGIRSWCKEFASRQNLEIDFESSVEDAIPFEIGVCFFRVLQEALHNALKHSGVRHFDVQLLSNSGEIVLVIGDSGRGFEIETAMRGHGLGLTSMQERVRLIGGTIVIDSKLSGGTIINIRVPYGAHLRLQQVAG